MPSAAAEARGAAAGAAILDQHAVANAGVYPETVSVNLWGLDAIKTKGESVAIATWLVGARPVKEGTGRVARFELVPLEELGRPRIDVLCNMSGIFRCALRGLVACPADMSFVCTTSCCVWYVPVNMSRLPQPMRSRAACLPARGRQ
jgi:magnesium chelatase subunit H